MRIRDIFGGIAALALVASPTMAAAANPAGKLSVAPSARASATKGESNLAGGGGLLAVVALAAVIVGAIIIGESGNDSPSSP
jgi:hypothetical protein